MTEAGASAADIPPHRYTAALAGVIEPRWQDYWEARGTFDAPNPTGELADPTHPRAGAPKMYVHDMFPYPSGDGLHVGHPLGYIGTDVFTRYKRMNGFNVLHPMGFDAFGLPAEQHAVATGTHPRITVDTNTARYWSQLRRLGMAYDNRRRFATTDPDYFRWTQWIFLQIFNSWYDEDADRARPIDELVAEFEAGTRSHAGRPAVGRTVRSGASGGGRRPPAGVRLERAGQLVPGPGHGAGQRGGHRRRAQRTRQLPGLQARAEAVDDADHGVRRPPGRRPGRAGLAGAGQADAEELDRPFHRRTRRLPGRGRQADPGLHHPPGHAVRRDLHGDGAGAPRRRRADRRTPGRRASRRCGPAGTRRRPTPSPPTAARPPRRPRWSAPPRRARRPASSPARTRPTRSTAR